MTPAVEITASYGLLAKGAAEIGVALDRTQLERFDRYFHEMLKWNSRVNLTSVTEWESVQTTHFLDSLTVSRAAPSGGMLSGRLLDVGSGAGFPGVPLKIAFPHLRVTLIESRGKKTAFLRRLAEVLDIELDVRTGRAESLAHQPDLRARFDLVTSRAVGSLSVLAELCLPFCRIGGMVIAQKRGNVDEELGKAGYATEAVGGRWKGIEEVPSSLLGDGRRLVLMEKVQPTPPRYPSQTRRSGKASAVETAARPESCPCLLTGRAAPSRRR